MFGIQHWIARNRRGPVLQIPVDDNAVNGMGKADGTVVRNSDGEQNQQPAMAARTAVPRWWVQERGGRFISRPAAVPSWAVHTLIRPSS